MELKHTALFKLHEELGAKLVPFAAYSMPVSYPEGIIHEHLHTRSQAGLFDVSHMGQLIISGEGTTAALEKLMPVDLETLEPGRQTYALFTNEQGGVMDDLMISKLGNEKYLLVVNAACKENDIRHLQNNLPEQQIEYLEDRGLLALQGPAAKKVLADFVEGLEKMAFMQFREASITLDGGKSARCYINRCGYTGEDGFEISVSAEDCEALARLLLQHPSVKPVGLGARDSLRLEAGLCLYGHELNESGTPVEASLNWSISKSRRPGGAREGGFPGAELILAQMRDGTDKKLIGLKLEGRIAAREGAEIINAEEQVIGEVSSGGFSPSLEIPIAMAYVQAQYAREGEQLFARVRNKRIPATVCRMPFVPHQYYRL